MTVPIVLPDIGSDRVRFGQWLVECGECVASGAIVAEAIFPGALVAIVAPSEGRIASLDVRARQPLAAGQRLGTIAAATN